MSAPTTVRIESASPTRDAWFLFGSYCALYVTTGLIVELLIMTPAVLERTWAEAGLADQFDVLSARAERWRVLGYATTPLAVLVKVGFTAGCLAVGTALASWDVRFADLFRVSLQAEVVWAVAAVLQIAAVLLLVDVRTVQDFQQFYPLSALSLVDLEREDLWMTYLLKSINVFEPVYVGALVFAAAPVLRKPRRHVAALIAVSYGTGFVLLIAAMTFAAMSLT